MIIEYEEDGFIIREEKNIFRRILNFFKGIYNKKYFYKNGMEVTSYIYLGR